MDLLEVLQNRHSIRTYTGEEIPEEMLQTIIHAGLLSPSSRSIRPWELIVVREKDKLQQLAACRVGSAKMLEYADAAIVVIADATLSDVWVEDCAIVMSNMHLMADSLGVGSCWIQGRLREASNGQSTEAYIREILHYPESFCLEAILSLGMPAKQMPKKERTNHLRNKVHYEIFDESK